MNELDNLFYVSAVLYLLQIYLTNCSFYYITFTEKWFLSSSPSHTQTYLFYFTIF